MSHTSCHTARLNNIEIINTNYSMCAVRRQTKYTFQLPFSFTFANVLSKQNTVGINTEVIDSLTTNVNSYFRCFSLFMMVFSISTVHFSKFILFGGKQIILHSCRSLVIDSTLDARVNNKRIFHLHFCFFF